MLRLSSNMTLVLKVFIPTFWIVFFTLFLIAIFISDSEALPLFHFPLYRYGFVAFYLLFLAFLYFTFIQLKRVDMDSESIYVTNYIKTYRYPLADIKSFKMVDNIIFKLGIIELHAKGKFGKKIYFYAKAVNAKELEQQLKTS